MKIVITGNKGYIGSELHKLLPNATGIDLKQGLDIRNIQELNCDTLIHLAALVQVGESVKNPLEYYDTNINGTINLLKKFKGNHFMFASTGAAASDLTSPYAISKKAAEEIIIEYCTKNNIQYTIFRFYNVIGGTPTNPDGLFYALRSAVNTGVLKIFGNDYNTKDGTAVRDYVHVEEIVETIYSLIDHPTNSIESLGHGVGYTVKEISEKFREVNDLKFDIIYENRREGDLEFSVLKTPSVYMKYRYNFEELVKI